MSNIKFVISCIAGLILGFFIGNSIADKLILKEGREALAYIKDNDCVVMKNVEPHQRRSAWLCEDGKVLIVSKSAIKEASEEETKNKTSP